MLKDDSHFAIHTAQLSSSSFYTYGALPADYPHYVTRHADQVVWRSILQGRMFYTIAPRQMGKTSLMKRVATQLEQQGWCCPFIDLATLRNLDRARWFRAVAESIAQACQLSEIRSALNDQQDFRNFLLQEIGLARRSKPIRLILFFDEVEGLLDLPFSDDFLMTVRDMYQQRDSYAGQLLAGFAGACDPQTLVKNGAISPFNIAEEITLDDFNVRESQQLTSKLEFTSVMVHEDVHAHIYSWANGHPYLTQRICEQLEEAAITGSLSEITCEAVDRLINTRLLSQQSRDKNIKHILHNVSRPAITSLRIWQKLQRGEIVSSRESGFGALHLAGVATEDSLGRVCFRNRLYHEALLNSGLLNIEDKPAKPASHQRRSSIPILNQGQTWAALVGINAYTDPYITDLSVCVDDVSAVHKLLAPEYAVARLLTDSSANGSPTRSQILGALSSMSQNAGEDDLLVFYFSGHGMAKDGESYLLPSDASLSALKHTAIAMRDVHELMEQSQARAKVLILDACHSGASLGKAASTMTSAFMQRVFNNAEGVAVLASCKQGQLSWEWREERRSVFTYYLLQAIEGKADFDNKGFVTISDVHRYVTDRIKIWTATRGIAQTPTLQYTVAGEIVLNYCGQ